MSAVIYVICVLGRRVIVVSAFPYPQHMGIIPALLNQSYQLVPFFHGDQGRPVRATIVLRKEIRGQ